jgi:heme/copper-type cytochrome/quinol oxidase subunit 2
VTNRRLEILMWLGLFGAPVAWAASHVIGWAVSEADCEPVDRKWALSFDTWVAVLGGIAVLLAIAGLVGAALTYRAVKGTDNDADPPAGRLWLLSVAGLILTPLLLVLILLTGSGALLLSHCHQG